MRPGYDGESQSTLKTPSHSITSNLDDTPKKKAFSWPALSLIFLFHFIFFLPPPEVSGYDKRVVYQNYAHDDKPPSVLYGYEEWRHERLSGLKRKYDPHGLFTGYHAVPAELAEGS